MYELQTVLDDLKNNIPEIEVSDKIQIDACQIYTKPSFFTSGGWGIYMNGGKFMRFSAIKTFTINQAEVTYFIHLRAEGGRLTVADAGNEPAVISSDGLIMFLNRPPEMPHILCSSEFCDIEIYHV